MSVKGKHGYEFEHSNVNLPILFKDKVVGFIVASEVADIAAWAELDLQLGWEAYSKDKRKCSVQHFTFYPVPKELRQ